MKLIISGAPVPHIKATVFVAQAGMDKTTAI